MKTINVKLKLAMTLLTVISVLSFMGCNNENTVNPGTNSDNLDLSAKATSETPVAGSVILQIDEVKVLLKDIKLNVAASSQNMTNFKTGPFVLNLNFNSNATVVSSGYIPVNTYDKVRFEIHKLADGEVISDPEFSDGFGRYSVIVKGHSNGVSFTFKSSMSSSQMVTLPKGLTVTAEGKSNITLEAKPYIWFLKNGVFLDPLNEVNRTDIELNIKNNINDNIRIFVDNDKNGQPD